MDCEFLEGLTSLHSVLGLVCRGKPDQSPRLLRILFDSLSAGKSSKDQRDTRGLGGKSTSQMSKVRLRDILGWAWAVHSNYSL